MNTTKTNQRSRAEKILSLLALVGVVGCYPLTNVDAEPSERAETASVEVLDMTAAPPRTAALKTVSTPALSFAGNQATYDVCANLPGWQRPDESIHRDQLEAMPRFGEAIQNEPYRELLAQFRSYRVLSFTTYGLSARFEPIYLTGLGSTIEAMDPCYEDEQPEQINRGVLAEVWLFGYEPVQLGWHDERYILTVNPIDKGFQVIQFRRLENFSQLPLSTQTIDGSPILVHSGDW